MPFWLQSDDLGGRGWGVKSYGFPVFQLFFLSSSSASLEPERLNRLLPLMAQTACFDAEQTLFRFTIITLNV